MKFLGQYLKDRLKIIIVFLVFCLIFISALVLYKMPAGVVLYPTAVCISLGIVFIIFDCRTAYKKHKLLESNKRLSGDLMEYFPEIKTIDDADYQQIIDLLLEEQKKRSTKHNIQYTEMVDYYTVWAHQIKTPIAAMSLKLQNEDSELSRSIAEDLSRIEQYVEMVLMFLRLDSDYTDYVIQKYSLDLIMKDCVKKFAPQFIRKKIRLDYNITDTAVLTDEKWLSFVIEQVLSNALKYTTSGTISLYLENGKTLCIKDTGIGIAQEDLPRIFDKGYTGYNGRSDKRASGIGLYLCKRICNNLGHTIMAESVLDEGTTIKINLEKNKLEVE